MKKIFFLFLLSFVACGTPGPMTPTVNEQAEAAQGSYTATQRVQDVNDYNSSLQKNYPRNYPTTDAHLSPGDASFAGRVSLYSTYPTLLAGVHLILQKGNKDKQWTDVSTLVSTVGGQFSFTGPLEHGVYQLKADGTRYVGHVSFKVSRKPIAFLELRVKEAPPAAASAQ